MKRINPAARVAEAVALPGAKELSLPPRSFRDASGVLPAAAHAALHRRFGDAAIAEAVRGSRLVAHRTSDTSDVQAVMLDVVRRERSKGRSVSVYTHTHPSTAELSAALASAGINHEQVGFTETFGDGLQAQYQMLCWALARTAEPRKALAIYMRSLVRGRHANSQGKAILDRSNRSFEAALPSVVEDLTAPTDPAPDTGALLEVIRLAHSRLGFPRGQETWDLVNRQLKRASRLLSGAGGFDAFAGEVDRLRAETLVDIASARPKAVQVMNLHQTKGREADATVLVLQADEYHGTEIEPFPTASRLLYVCMTRARERAHIIAPEKVHNLWLPLVNACISVSTEPNS